MEQHRINELLAVAVIDAETNSPVTRLSSATSSAEKTHYHGCRIG